MDWITMSLEARNLAYNNVEHVGPENARKKTEEWAAASQTLRQQRLEHLDLAYGNGERNKWDLYPANDQKVPCFVHIHGGYWQRGSKEIFACLFLAQLDLVVDMRGVAFGTGELPAMISSSRDYHAYRSLGHVPGDLIPIANTNHFTNSG